MDSSIKNEVLNDFKTALKSVDFSSYNPNSSEFLTALNLGLMWNILCEMNDDGGESTPTTSDHKSVDTIDEEISGAKKYLQKFSETQDSVFKEMANDELKHASILIKKAYSKLPSGEEKMKLKSYEDEIKMISEMM
jgi:hypothetical protein